VVPLSLTNTILNYVPTLKAKAEPSKPLARLLDSTEGAALPVVSCMFMEALLQRDPAVGGLALRTPDGLAASTFLHGDSPPHPFATGVQPTTLKTNRPLLSPATNQPLLSPATNQPTLASNGSRVAHSLTVVIIDQLCHTPLNGLKAVRISSRGRACPNNHC
jgi:hypothetical protein